MPADASRQPQRAGLIADLLPPAVAAVESAGHLPEPGLVLFPVEEAVMHTAGPRRRAEFAAGRLCARAALARLGVPAAPILPGPAGQPRWPAGVTGSITHCAGYRACAVARTTDVAAIGIDAEPDAALPAGLIDMVATGPERAWIRRHAAARRGAAVAGAGLPGAGGPGAGQRDAGGRGAGPPAVCWDRLLFSAKEAACKLWYPLTGQWPGLRAAVIGLATTGTFTVCLPGPGPGAGDRPATRLTGRWLASGGLIVTAIAWTP
ncbi:MAG TPA: 4'-phosphopantetheinyl transferase [Streptosporangiaceae bacterium]